MDIFKKRTTPKYPYPEIELQGKPKPSPTDIDPATGEEYGAVASGELKGKAAVSPDHIVPKAEIVQLPRFTGLTPDQQWAVLSTPLNLAWIGTLPNKKKGSRAVEDMGGVLPAW